MLTEEQIKADLTLAEIATVEWRIESAQYTSRARTALPEYAKALMEAMEERKWLLLQLKAIHLRCSCVNWMGGCSHEYDCAYGRVHAMRDKLEKRVATYNAQEKPE